MQIEENEIQSPVKLTYKDIKYMDRTEAENNQ